MHVESFSHTMQTPQQNSKKCLEGTMLLFAACALRSHDFRLTCPGKSRIHCRASLAWPLPEAYLGGTLTVLPIVNRKGRVHPPPPPAGSHDFRLTLTCPGKSRIHFHCCASLAWPLPEAYLGGTLTVLAIVKRKKRKGPPPPPRPRPPATPLAG